MIAETGLAALWLAAGLAALQFLLMILALRSGADVRRGMRAIAVVQGVLTLIAFAMLLLVFARSDMSVALVFENSNTAKPFIYKVAGAWGNHEGSMLLWVTVLSVAFSFAVGALLTGEVDSRLARAMRPWVLGAWILLTLGITAGSYWAYYEHGWGGYWFWDPVENASLMPWLAADRKSVV